MPQNNQPRVGYDHSGSGGPADELNFNNFTARHSQHEKYILKIASVFSLLHGTVRMLPGKRTKLPACSNRRYFRHLPPRSHDHDALLVLKITVKEPNPCQSMPIHANPCQSSPIANIIPYGIAYRYQTAGAKKQKKRKKVQRRNACCITWHISQSRNKRFF